MTERWPPNTGLIYNENITTCKKNSVMLSAQEQLRYARQISLPQIGSSGQLRLKQARVLIIGLGGLGCPAALYLAAAGVGCLGLVDPDHVALSNLQRQILYTPADLGQPKVLQAQASLQRQNPDLQVESFPWAVTADSVMELIAEWDLILDGSDQLNLRYLLDAACRHQHKTWIYASVYRFEGQLAVFSPQGPCYRCLFPDPPAAGALPDCNAGGVLGVLPGLLGTLQALEALKILLGYPPAQHLLLVDGLELRFDSVQLSQDPNCPGCGPQPRPPAQPTTDSPTVAEIAPQTLLSWLAHHPSAQVLDVRPQAGGAVPAPLSGARHWPLESGLPQDLPAQNRPLLLFCQRGQRSLRGAQQLKSAGFSEVYSLSGGLEALQEFSLIERKEQP